jgi:hypothetical protein
LTGIEKGDFQTSNKSTGLGFKAYGILSAFKNGMQANIDPSLPKSNESMLDILLKKAEIKIKLNIKMPWSY